MLLLWDETTDVGEVYIYTQNRQYITIHCWSFIHNRVYPARSLLMVS